MEFYTENGYLRTIISSQRHSAFEYLLNTKNDNNNNRITIPNVINEILSHTGPVQCLCEHNSI